MNKETLFAGYDLENGKMAWIEVEVKVFEGKKTFSLCSNECDVTKWGREEKLEYVESALECYDSDWLLDRLKEFDCKWSELPDELISEFDYNDSFGEHYYDINPLTDADGLEYHCDIVACGQHDIRESVYPLTPQITRLLEIWDEYHLKVIPDEVDKEISALVEAYEVELEKLNDEMYQGNGYLVRNIFMGMCEYLYNAKGLY